MKNYQEILFLESLAWNLKSLNQENGIICQCKHIQKFSDLKSNLKKEVEKLPNINGLKTYYLIVSTKLTPANENTIIKMFDKYITSSEKIAFKIKLLLPY